LLLIGLVLGKWWRIVVPAAAVGWVVALVATGVGSGLAFALGAGLLAVANVIVGVLGFQSIRVIHSWVRGRTAPTTHARGR
jgi:hypothetical protein